MAIIETYNNLLKRIIETKKKVKVKVENHFTVFGVHADDQSRQSAFVNLCNVFLSHQMSK